jgi:hypothetical protein
MDGNSRVSCEQRHESIDLVVIHGDYIGQFCSTWLGDSEKPSTRNNAYLSSFNMDNEAPAPAMGSNIGEGVDYLSGAPKV